MGEKVCASENATDGLCGKSAFYPSSFLTAGESWGKGAVPLARPPRLFIQKQQGEEGEGFVIALVLREQENQPQKQGVFNAERPENM